jgi:hypothetical protein
VTGALAEREAEIAAALASPEGQSAPAAIRDLLARTQADFVSAALGLVAANAEVERLTALVPDEG